MRALADVGDTRTLWALRRVAREDRGKTSWGEPVATTAKQALARLQTRSAVRRFAEPVKTALSCVAMFAALLFAAGRVQAVREELRRDVPLPAGVVVVVPTATPEPEELLAASDLTPTPAPTATPAPTPTPVVITGTVKGLGGNIRSSPQLGDNVIGLVNAGDELIFLGVSGDWYLVRLGNSVAEGSRIEGVQGWVSNIVVNEPSGTVPEITPTPAP